MSCQPSREPFSRGTGSPAAGAIWSWLQVTSSYQLPAIQESCTEFAGGLRPSDIPCSFSMRLFYTFPIYARKIWSLGWHFGPTGLLQRPAQCFQPLSLSPPISHHRSVENFKNPFSERPSHVPPLRLQSAKTLAYVFCFAHE